MNEYVNKNLRTYEHIWDKSDLLKLSQLLSATFLPDWLKEGHMFLATSQSGTEVTKVTERAALG